MIEDNELVKDWSESSMREVLLNEQDDFLKIKETLSRIGIGSVKDGKKILYPSCHILHKKGKYYIVHFKELFALDGKNFNLTVMDVKRRDAITNLLEEWGLCRNSGYYADADVREVRLRVLKYSEKKDWEIVPKYNIGNN